MPAAEEDKVLYGHMFDDVGGRSGRDEGSEGEEGEEDDLLESETEGEEDGSEDEEDELAMFGEVGTHWNEGLHSCRCSLGEAS